MQGNGVEGSRSRLSLLATLSVVGQLVLLASAWLLPFASEFNLVGDNISELVLGRFGFVQAGAFLVSGFTTLGLAVAIQGTTVRSRGSVIGVLLVAIFGAGGVLSALFPTDRIDRPGDLESLTATGSIHVGVALASFLSIIIGMFVLTWTFRRQAQWRPILIWLVLLFTSALSLFFGQTQGPHVGLMQRLLVTAISLWLILVACRIRSVATSAQ